MILHSNNRREAIKRCFDPRIDLPISIISGAEKGVLVFLHGGHTRHGTAYVHARAVRRTVAVVPSGEDNGGIDIAIHEIWADDSFAVLTDCSRVRNGIVTQDLAGEIVDVLPHALNERDGVIGSGEHIHEPHSLADGPRNDIFRPYRRSEFDLIERIVKSRLGEFVFDTRTRL